MKTPMRIIPVALAAVLAARAVMAQSVAYDDPEGGWSYAYLGDAAAPGVDMAEDFDALDATWDRGNGSDEWDGSGLGGTIMAGNAPGGVAVFSDGGVDYIRIQDTGDPRAAPTSLADPTNRKIYLAHDVATDPGVTAPATILQGVTLSFRARIATAATGPVDGQYPAMGGNNENGTVAHGTAWPAGGSGLLGHDGGKGNFGIRQTDGDQIISFSLNTETDTRNDGSPVGMSGLNMNSMVGTTPAGGVDPFDNEGTINFLPISDVTTFHEFWITIQADQAGGGTHKVDIYVDGSEVPMTFNVTSGTGNDYDLSYIAMGAGATPQQVGIDVDFFAYKEGLHLPGGPLVDGDTNGDGDVTIEDFDPIRDNFRQGTNVRAEGDLTGDGVVDFFDFREWKGAFLAGGGSLAGVDLGLLTSVPEPSGLVLWLSALSLAAVKRSRRQRPRVS